jgi:malic enzyme
MVTAAAKKLAALAGPDNLMPEMMDPATHTGVAQAVMAVRGKGTPLVK